MLHKEPEWFLFCRLSISAFKMAAVEVFNLLPLCKMGWVKEAKNCKMCYNIFYEITI